MFVLRTSWFSRALFEVFAVGLVAAQNTPVHRPLDLAPAPPSVSARNSISFDDFVGSAIRQERRLTDLMRNFKPIVETYIQEEKPDANLGSSPKSDDYFLSRLDLSGSTPATVAFVDPERPKQGWMNKFRKAAHPFAAAGFAQALFPDLGHFDGQNYTFEFVRWEVLGEVRCAAIDVRPRENPANRGFSGRIWVEDQDFNIVRFSGAYTSKAFSKRSFHFDSWRLNTLGIVWMPA
jgi:hypothetical protein